MKSHLRSVITGFEQNGNTVAVLAQHNTDGTKNGFIEVVVREAGKPAKCVGMYEDARLIEALNIYHKYAEAMKVANARTT